MLTKRFKISCSEINIRINEIKTKKVEFDDTIKVDISNAKILKKELQTLCQQIEEQLKPFITIEGKEFPVFSLEIGGKTVDELEKELLSKNFQIYSNAKDMLHSPDFVTSPTVEQIDLVRLKVSDLGFPSEATTDEIYAKARKLGLELCPAEVGPHQRLKDADQPRGERYKIAMKPITVHSNNSQTVFEIRYFGGSLWLFYDFIRPDHRWDADGEFVFCLPSFDSDLGKQVFNEREK